MRTVRLRRRFGLVIAPFNTVLHLYAREDLDQFFTRVQHHLTTGGRFVFDFAIPDPTLLARNPNRRFGAPRFRHPTTGQIVSYAERFEYDAVRQLLLVWMDFSPVDGQQPWTVPLTHRQYFPQEMAAYLHFSGFRDQTWSADFGDQPPSADADWLTVACRLGSKKTRRAQSGGPRHHV